MVKVFFSPAEKQPFLQVCDGGGGKVGKTAWKGCHRQPACYSPRLALEFRPPEKPLQSDTMVVFR
ncbi:RNA-binding protein [Anopheles sinensis]|uniref:RNA-binding protein n=1 Tax=Anopheles sinensis TaxID=74873 RepID=A0A084VS92_ANOSI|nr:RNA-binding protein [Anopheles sinensis]